MAIETLHLTVHGMTCGNCARSVERKLTGTAGVTKAVVDLTASAATVDYDSAQAVSYTHLDVYKRQRRR